MTTPAPKAHIRFPKTGQTCEVDRDDTLVDATFRYELPIRYRCERAVCTTCLVEVLKGIENLSPPGARELQTLESAGLQGRFRLACQVSVRGDVELDYVPLLDPRRKPRPTGDDLLV
ncbi:MAG TPA: 2Fe-2S iron-sulfur cluster-binding protein [bacterium]|nr:2Fe-2S iron-sulfur cluster-binding protein [bacterium]